jgi:hypothetical protein
MNIAPIVVDTLRCDRVRANTGEAERQRRQQPQMNTDERG